MKKDEYLDTQDHAISMLESAKEMLCEGALEGNELKKEMTYQLNSLGVFSCISYIDRLADELNVLVTAALRDLREMRDATNGQS